MLVDGKMKLVKNSSIYMSVINLLYLVECLKVSRKYRDVIQNVNKSGCDQLSNTVWGRSNGLCKCSSRDRTFHIVNGTAGCFRRSKISPGTYYAIMFRPPFIILKTLPQIVIEKYLKMS